MRGLPRALVCLLPWVVSAQYNILTFHGDAQRTGWISQETILTPGNVEGGAFGPLWDSPQFDSIVISGRTYPPHLYASPLYVDSLHAVYAATSNGFVYAVSATRRAVHNGRGTIAPGAILWKRQLGAAGGGIDGVPVGIVGTPVIDLAASPARLYVASCDATRGWEVYALDIRNGGILPGWPLAINNSTLTPINRNGPAAFQSAASMGERGALNLSPDGTLLYVPFGAYNDNGTGWMVAVDTRTPALASAFSAAPSSLPLANGGMWASGGPAVDAEGNVYSTTGNGTLDTTAVPGYWGQSVLVWGPGSPLRLVGTYTPWNYCQMDQGDVDLAGGAAIVLPDLGANNTSTPRLITFGGKQGNQYLVDRDHMPGSLVTRELCGTDPSADRSLMPPQIQLQFGKRGPLNVFGPYSEAYGMVDYAKGRTTGAYFRSLDGGHFLFVTGSSKTAADSQQTAPPCLVKLRIRTAPGAPAYLAVEASENTLGFLSPGSPWVTSNGSSDAVVWVLVANLTRSASLAAANTPHPILYAIDPDTLRVLWSSTPAMLHVGGKYNAPGFGPGMVFVGTDRIQAFGVDQSRLGPGHVR